MFPVADLLPMFKIKVSDDSLITSSIVVTVTENEVTPVGMVIVPSKLFVTPFEKV